MTSEQLTDKELHEEATVPEPVKWHHPECKGECLACLIERTVQSAYGSIGLNYLQKHTTTPPQQKPLLDAEADELVRRFARYELIRATEAKHGIVA